MLRPCGSIERNLNLVQYLMLHAPLALKKKVVRDDCAAPHHHAFYHWSECATLRETCSFDETHLTPFKLALIIGYVPDERVAATR
jgi:hypothetical protein